jgi:amylosucrase
VPEAKAVLAALDQRVAGASVGLADGDLTLIRRRLARWGHDLLDGLAVYGRAGGSPALAERIVDDIVRCVARRRPALRELDECRTLRPDWFLAPDQIGYVCYADRFAGTLHGVREHVSYLEELGVTYLHLMPLLHPRAGADDGGYAVVDYNSVRPDLGTMSDLAELADALHQSGIALTLDLVVNHVAREHEWAQKAVSGQEPYRSYFLVYPNRDRPDAYEATLPEVFPDFAPGNFTWVPETAWPSEPSRRGAWVWTTFNDYQWDLDWSNPDVFCEMLHVILDLANVGVDCFRLDAIAFIWKRLGTNCQGQPEVHQIVQALRAALRIAAPAVVFKAEAIVAPEDLSAYLGRGTHAGKVCDLAYHNNLMVQIWSALATGESALIRRALSAAPPKPVTTAWGTYVRCHDDIGWAISDADAASLGFSGFAHRAFLSRFYSGNFPGSFARGEVFQANLATGDARISGTLASLAGLQAALENGDPGAVDVALGRIFLVHAIIFGFGGVPLIYMGDELGLRNDHSYLSDPRLADDNRWTHRPRMPWVKAELRRDPATIEGRIFGGVRHLAQVRSVLPSLHAAVESVPVDLGAEGVLGLLRRHPAGNLVGLYNVSDRWQHVAFGAVADAGVADPWERLSTFTPEPNSGFYAVPPYAAWWLTEPPDRDSA